MGNSRRLPEPGVRKRGMHRHLLAWRYTVFEQRRSDVQCLRNMGDGCIVHEQGMRQWSLHRRLRPEHHKLFGNHSANV